MRPFVHRLFPFLAWRERVDAASMRADAIAGVVGGLVVLPQGVAYATLAGLPPEYGLYTAMVPAIVAALWGSSRHMISGPTNALSLVVFAVLAPLAIPGSADYVTLALTLSLMMGAAQLAMGVARLGALVNFISHTVIVGFTAGAGLLIIAAQLKNFFGIRVDAGASFFASLAQAAGALRNLDPAVTATGAVTLVTAILAKRFVPRIPYMVVAMIVGSLVGFALIKLAGAAVPVVGVLPSAFPSPSLPSFDPDVWRKLAPAALALTVLGLTEAVSISRAIALRSGQRIDGNQEFVGQGLSNVAGAFFSSYPSSGSFNRSGVNYEAGARTALSALCAAAVLAVVLFVVGPLVAWLPLAVMAALLFVVAWGLIDFQEMRRVFRANRGDALVLVVTFVSTLTLQLEFAIFVGVLASLLVYLNRTTHPRVVRLAPHPGSSRLVQASAAAPPLPHVDVVRIDGSLFFGAVEHVRDSLERVRHERPDVRNLVIVTTAVNFVDVAGAELLAQVAREMQEAGVAVHVCGVKHDVREVLERSGAIDAIGRERVHETEDEALRAVDVGVGSVDAGVGGVDAKGVRGVDG